MVKNPLRKRFLRELRSDLGKYITIFLLLVLSIAEISGFLVADESMITAYDESFEKYNIENGNFTVEKKLTARQEEAIASAGVSVCELFFTDQLLTNGTTMRFFKMRDQVDLACLMDGAFPAAADEVAIDRMYADNNDLTTGDTITDAGTGKIWRISGLVALSDYSCLFESNNDTMFDSKQFGVCVVSPEAFAAYDTDQLTIRYAWKYNQEPADEVEEKDMAEALMNWLSGIVSLTGFIPRYQNQAITFTGEDMGSDRAMMMIFLYAIIVIVAFVFTITISNTITQEATVIGTLRATGYTRGELVRHYMTLPIIVTLIAALIGNILGYTVMKNLNANLYYGSYSLPTYVTLWSPDAFLETTVVPIILMIVITFLVLHHKLKISPLRFLRRDLKKTRKRGALRLSPRISFFRRFRLRIIFQNMSSYVMLLVGILFSNFLLLFGLMFPSVLASYMDSLQDNMLAEHQLVLQIPAGALREDRKVESMVNMLLFQSAVETDNPTAEKFSAYSLKTIPQDWVTGEDLLVYGIAPGSKYVELPERPGAGEAWVSRAYAEKWKLSAGDTITLKEAYADTTYDFTVKGIYPYDSALCIFLDQDVLNETFDLGEGTFSGYFSDTEITDIDEKYIGQQIDLESLSKVSRQLTISMGEMMYIVDVFAILIYMILIYILTKLIIEKNAAAISMTKILGYNNREIARLYLLVTTILVLLFMVLSIPVEVALLEWVFRVMIRTEMTGWIPFILSNDVYVKMFLYGAAAYAVVALFEYRKIRRVPMEEVLKNVE